MLLSRIFTGIGAGLFKLPRLNGRSHEPFTFVAIDLAN
jgi:hypothetical protein